LPNFNLFTQHVLFILWRDTASELWTLVLLPSYSYHLFTLLAYYYHFPLDTLIPFVSSKPVRLTTSSQVGNKVPGCVCAGSALLLAEDESTSNVKWRPCWSAIKPVRITFGRLSLLSWSTYLGFLTERKSCCYIHHTFLLGFPTGWTFN
jgi:hypothetical protein